jgi:hypothetical protein
MILKAMRKTVLNYITLSNFLLDGMVSLFPTGYSNYTDLELNILVKFVVITYIWDVNLLKSTSKSLDMLMA